MEPNFQQVLIFFIIYSRNDTTEVNSFRKSGSRKMIEVHVGD